MAGLLGGGNNQQGGGGGLLGGLLGTVDDTTKGLPIVGGVTSPLLKTVGGVVDGLPIVRLALSPLSHPSLLANPLHRSDPAVSAANPNSNTQHLNNNTTSRNQSNTRLRLPTSLRLLPLHRNPRNKSKRSLLSRKAQRLQRNRSWQKPRRKRRESCLRWRRSRWRLIDWR